MRKHKSDRIIGVITVILLIIGLVIIYSIGPMRANFLNSSYGGHYSEDYFFIHQLTTVGISLVAFIFAFKFSYEKMRKLSRVVIFLGLLSCLVLAILGKMGSSLAKCELGACRWISFGSFGSFQPAEFLKLGLVMYLSQLAAQRKREGTLEKSDFLLPLAVVSVLSILFVVVFQNDLGSAVVVVGIILAIMFMSGMSWKKIACIVVVLLVGGVCAILFSAHRMQRLMTFLSSEGSNSYHIDNALLAIGTGGFAGVGIGNSVQATGYLPESINDSVFAIIGETFGFVGLALVLCCFFVLLFRILKITELYGDEEHGLIAAGAFAWVGTHVVVNIAAMTGLIPLTGITLPLLSYGGTSMMFVSFILGLCLQLSCYTKRSVKKLKYDNEKQVSVQNINKRRSSR